MKKRLLKMVLFTAIGLLGTMWSIGVLNMCKWFFDWVFANNIRYFITILIFSYLSLSMVSTEFKIFQKSIDNK